MHKLADKCIFASLHFRIILCRCFMLQQQVRLLIMLLVIYHTGVQTM